MLRIARPSARPATKADAETHDDRQEPLRRHHRANAGGARAERNAHPDFARALSDRVGGHTPDPKSRQPERHQRKCAHHTNENARSAQVSLPDVAHRADVIERLIGIQGSDGGTQRRRHSGRL